MWRVSIAWYARSNGSSLAMAFFRPHSNAFEALSIRGVFEKKNNNNNNIYQKVFQSLVYPLMSKKKRVLRLERTSIEEKMALKKKLNAGIMSVIT